MDNLKVLIKDLATLNVMGVEYLGGEPTLFKGFATACHYANKEGLKVRVVSNGFDLDRKMLRKVGRDISEFVISLDGTAETHNKLRRNPMSYQQAAHSLFEHLIILKISVISGKSYKKPN